jgi:hypothetical protein
VEDRWGEAIKEAAINLKLDLKIEGMGPVK